MIELETSGFAVIQSFLSKDETDYFLQSIKNNINKAAKNISVETKDYLSCTGRWATKSIITRDVSNILENRIKEYLENSLQSKITCKKANVICKTSDITDPVPFHQDISYSVSDPYHFSMWLSLNDVEKNSAPLEIVKNSHKKKIEPAADFWSPYFVDQYDIKNGSTEKITVNAGDAIIFDSKLWHGSGKNNSRKDRFAYVTRWVIEKKDFPQIPPIQKSSFGMFNCGELTHKILEQSLLLIYSKHKKILNKENLIKIWMDILTQNPNILGINSSAAIRDLRKLDILNKACDLHDAGNISGLVYKNLWKSLLSILNNEIKLVNLD